jgi:hypothetical protein
LYTLYNLVTSYCLYVRQHLTIHPTRVMLKITLTLVTSEIRIHSPPLRTLELVPALVSPIRHTISTHFLRPSLTRVPVPETRDEYYPPGIGAIRCDAMP